MATGRGLPCFFESMAMSTSGKLTKDGLDVSRNVGVLPRPICSANIQISNILKKWHRSQRVGGSDQSVALTGLKGREIIEVYG